MYSIFKKQKVTEEKIDNLCFPDSSVSTSSSNRSCLKSLQLIRKDGNFIVDLDNREDGPRRPVPAVNNLYY